MKMKQAKTRVVSHGDNYDLINPIICPECGEVFPRNEAIEKFEDSTGWWDIFYYATSYLDCTCKKCGCNFVAEEDTTIDGVDSCRLGFIVSIIIAILSLIGLIVSICFESGNWIILTLIFFISSLYFISGFAENIS